jgi:hypothetical protein
MSQNDFNIANQGFPATRADINSALQALASTSAGTTAPSTTYAYQMWYDETDDLLKMRNSDNDAWITLAAFDQAAGEWELRSAVIQAVDSAGVVIKTDDGTTRVTVADSGNVTLANDLVVTGTVQASNISATGSMAARNKIINGAMVIDQRNAGAAVTTDTYCPDRWRVEEVTDGAFSAQQVSDAPSGFTNSLKWTVTTADASLGATQYANVRQGIEGFNVADFGWGTASAATVTLSFWVKSSLTGTFGGVFSNADFNRSYPFTYVINSANTWEQKTITVAGDTSGTWNKTNGAGIQLNFGLGVGSTYSGTAGAWTGSGLISVTGAVNVMGTLDATWYITGVQLEAGDTATPFEHRSYGQELALCQRYYYKIFPGATSAIFGPAYSFSTTEAQAAIPYPVTMRTAPTALEQSGTANHYTVVAGSSVVTCSAVPTHGASTTNYSAIVNATVSSGLTVGYGGLLRSDATNGANAYLGWSAEL